METPSAINEIHELIGAIVLSTQASERYLKLILPFTDAKDPSIGGALARAGKIKRRTLGDLIGRLVDASASRSANFETELARLVAARNRVVHHFGETYGKQLQEGRAQDVINALRVNRTNACALEQALEGLALRLIEEIRDTTFAGTAEFDGLNAICIEFRRRLGTTKRPAPSRTQ